MISAEHKIFEGANDYQRARARQRPLVRQPRFIMRWSDHLIEV